MRERPILFNGAMVRTSLSTAKMQTRPIAKHRRSFEPMSDACTFGQPDDWLRVRESFTDLPSTGVAHRPDPSGPIQRYTYSADTLPGSAGEVARKDYRIKWRPSIHMPRDACRLALEITDVRVERLQAISEADAWAEGCPTKIMDPVRWLRKTWANTGGDWDSNPWVWVVGFRPLEAGRHHATSDTKKEETQDGRS